MIDPKRARAFCPNARQHPKRDPKQQPLRLAKVVVDGAKLVLVCDVCNKRWPLGNAAKEASR